ncbi:heterokaryon incompatibility protein [Colletotrichum scovillei]|uniref:HET-domain-containing protein n=1 Tax=Colletotrichum scovillei TaxID=1209932 RepID=A0A9P7QTB9_9PEZI|nr:heterokaryon incompatibility protein [Colletotrichum scovillei]KAF4784448.1 heterokaryon incompatibility protein [Colletotrichum scovillei]KAG7040011.1 HET-domain-containing protein [Colletotrichum scovillei]KAG7042188.1 HET-domain-containing protein [Colletotrichum scovillei]
MSRVEPFAGRGRVRRMSLSLRIPDDQPSPQRRLPKHLIPFLPYLDRPDTSHAIEERIPAGKHALRLSTMAFWLRTCASSHGNHCVPPPRPGAARPLWLIDVRACCLVAVNDDREEENSSVTLYTYVALSYVWGQASSASATLANIAALQAPGALDGHDIPATIRDAMDLTRLLGERYLWVDRLCIVQDDKDAKPAQLQGMADIYGGATLTIVAAQGRGADEPLHHGLVNEAEEGEAESSQGALPCLKEISPEEWVQRLRESREEPSRAPRRAVSPAGDGYGSPLYYGYQSDQNQQAGAKDGSMAVNEQYLPFTMEYGGSPHYIGCGSPYDSPSPMDIESPNFLPASPSYTEVESPVVNEWNSPPSPVNEPLAVPQEDMDAPPDVPDTFSATETPNVRRQREVDAHRAIMEGHARDLVNTAWCQRGWTFQELMFSRRQLVFHNDTVNWQCHCASWHENQKFIVAEPCSGVGEVEQHSKNDNKDDSKDNSIENGNENRVSAPSSTELLPGVSPWPDFHRYARLVALYDKRVLTYDHDVHDAFAGVLSAFGQSFPGGFICGLPRIFFDAALLWQPYDPLVRRTSDLSSSLPNWSWMGWQGNLQSESWRSGYRYLRGGNPDDSDDFWRPDSWKTRRTVVWSYSLTVDGERFPVGDETAEFMDDSASKGWCEKYCERAQKPYFNHPQAGAQEFWFPIPLATTASINGSPPLCTPAYLHGITRRGSLQISKLFHDHRASQCVCATLCESNGRWAGVLRLNAASSDPEEYYGAAVGETCGLVEISSGSAENQPREDVGFDGWEEAEFARHRGKYKFVNVLWVEWRDGVAYRKALGRVWEAAWARVASEGVQITLG